MKITKLKISALLLAVLCVIFDYFTKNLASGGLKSKSITVIDGILTFEYCENRGAAFGIFADKRYIFMIVSLAAIAVIAGLILFDKHNDAGIIIPLALILGGGIGNMIDRIFAGYVVDFLHVTFIDFPIFNVADIFVTVGSVLLLLRLIFDKKGKADTTSDK